MAFRKPGKIAMLIELSNPWIIALNCLGIPLAHLLIAWVPSRLDLSLFRATSWLFRRKHWEASGQFYERVFRLRTWQKFLPDAAPLFSGFSKRNLADVSSNYLERFRDETCRGEFSHWLQMVVISAFIAWNPWPASIVIVSYAILSNIPCILSLRTTRFRISKLLERTRNRELKSLRQGSTPDRQPSFRSAG